MRRLRMQLTVLLALLGMLALAWGSAVFLAPATPPAPTPPLAGFPDGRVADDPVKADAEIRRALPLDELRAGQVVGLADLDEVAGSPALRELVARMGSAPWPWSRCLGLLALCWTEAEAVGRPYAEVLPVAGDQVGGPADLVSRYGRRVPVAVSSAPIFDARGRVVGGVDVIRDVSKEREIDEVKSALISTVSHELRTPSP